MLFYIAFIAILNLCAGYALGAYFGAGIGVSLSMPKIRMPKKKGKQDSSEAEQPADAAESEEASAPAPEPEAPPAEVSEAAVMSGLQAFQQQLTAMGKQLEESQDDADSFDACAKDIQEVNHAYLETAQQQVEGLDPEDECRKTVEAGAEEVGKISEEFDALVEEGLEDEQARAKLVDKSSELSEKVAEVKQEVRSQAIPVADGSEGLALLDSLLEEIDTVLAEDARKSNALAALVRADPPKEGDKELIKGMQTQIPKILSDAFTDLNHTAIQEDGQYLVLFEDKELAEVTAKVEELRQQVEKMTFVRGDKKLNATVTCAIADLPGAADKDELFQRLEEAMAESGRLGANRTYHHDGKFPTPVASEDSESKPQTIEV